MSDPSSNGRLPAGEPSVLPAHHVHGTPPARALPGSGETRRHVLVAVVLNKPGVLNRVSSLMRARNFNIDSLAVSHTDREDVSRMTITLHGDDVAVVKDRDVRVPFTRGANHAVGVDLGHGCVERLKPAQARHVLGGSVAPVRGDAKRRNGVGLREVDCARRSLEPSQVGRHLGALRAARNPAAEQRVLPAS